LTRFSISASSRSSWRRRSSCSRSSGVPASRRGSGGGSVRHLAAHLRQQLLLLSPAACRCGGARRHASPSSISGAGGSGEVARPLLGLAAAGQVACAMACGLGRAPRSSAR
jgi:hypothetical protein